MGNEVLAMKDIAHVIGRRIGLIITVKVHCYCDKEAHWRRRRERWRRRPQAMLRLFLLWTNLTDLPA